MSGTPGSRIKRVRNHLGFSQEEFCKKLGVSQFTLSNYETGKRFPDTRFLLKLKELANVDLNWLIWGDKTLDALCPGEPEDKEMANFFYWFSRLPIVRHSSLAGLEELKFKYPELFMEDLASAAGKTEPSPGSKR